MISKYLKSVKDADVNNKTVFLRADLDVPIKSGEILDTTRLKTWLPTLEYLLKSEAQVFITGHLGRPKYEDEKFSLKPVAEWIKKSLGLHNELKVFDIKGFKAWKITGNVFLLENLRFYKGEEENDKKFSEKLASLAEIYVNDAFASSHRAHASIVGVTEYLPNFAGYVLVGGKIAKEMGVILKVMHEKTTERNSSFLVADLTEDKKDITKNSVKNFLQIIDNAQTVVWNGPMGVTEEEDSSESTRDLALGILKSKVYSVVGGGDSLSYLRKQNLLSKFSFVSVGGGAMLEFLSGNKLSGLEALEVK